MIHKSRTRIIPYVITWDGIVTKYHKRHVEAIGITPVVEAYMQAVVLRKTLESISYDHRRSLYERGDGDEGVELAIRRLIGSKVALGAGQPVQPTEV